MNRRSEIYPDYIDLECEEEPPIEGDEAYRPRPSRRGLGWARRRDIDDRDSQSVAPRGVRGHYDSRPADRYERDLTDFVDRGRHHPGAVRRFDIVAGRWENGDGEPEVDARRAHAGRGPRGYRRSDQRILEDVCDALTDAADVDATEIEVNVAEGIVTLAGMVDSRRTKRRAEDIAATVTGVRDVQNQMRVAVPI